MITQDQQHDKHGTFKHWITHVQSPRVEQLLKQAATSDVISFAGALPEQELFPTTEIESAFQDVIADSAAEALQYHWCEGFEPLRVQIAARMTARGCSVTANDVLITNGAQQALDLLGKLTLTTGAPLALESPTYTAAIQAFELQRPEFIGVPRNDRGLELEALRTALTLQDPKLLYMVPTGHNPTGGTLNANERRGLLDVLRGRRTLMIEDDAYGDLQYGHVEKPVLAFDQNGTSANGNIAYVGSFSKILSPGLRVGWIVAGKRVLEELIKIKQASDLQTGTLTQLVLSRYLSLHSLDEHIAKSVVVYRERRDVMLAAIKKHFPAEVRWTLPEAGFSLWVELPSNLKAEVLLDEAVRRGVAFEPGRPFFPEARAQNFFRLSFSNQTVANIETGIRRLGALITERIGAAADYRM